MKQDLYIHYGCPYSKEDELSRLSQLDYEVLILDDVGMKPTRDIGCTYMYVGKRSIHMLVEYIEKFLTDGDFKLKYIFTLAEGSVNETNQLCKRFQLRPISIGEFDLRDKYRVREALNSQTGRKHICEKVSHAGQIRHFPSDDFPLFVKPVDSMESRNVKIVEDMTALVSACRDIFEKNRTSFVGDMGEFTVEEVYGLKNEALIETYYTGAEYSCEIVIVDGRVRFQSVTKKVTSGAPYFYECSQSVGQELSNDLDLEKLDQLIEQVIKINEYHSTILHLEFKFDSLSKDLELIEVNSRLAGDSIAQLLYLSSGVDLLDFFFKSIDQPDKKFDLPLCQRPLTKLFFTTEKQGEFSTLAKKYGPNIINWYFSDGEFVEIKSSKRSQRVGEVLVEGDHSESLPSGIDDNQFFTVTPAVMKSVVNEPSEILRDSVNRVFGGIGLFCCLVAVIVLSNFYQAKIDFLGNTLAKVLRNYVATGEVLSVAEMTSQFQEQDWFETIVIADNKFNLIHSSQYHLEDGSFFMSKVDRGKFSYSYPIEVDGFTLGYVLIKRSFVKPAIILVLILTCISVVLAIIYVLLSKFVFKKYFNKTVQSVKDLTEMFSDIANLVHSLGQTSDGSEYCKFREKIEVKSKNDSELDGIYKEINTLLFSLEEAQRKIDENKKLQSLYMQSNKQYREEQNKKMVLAELSAQVSHDIKSPLAALQLISTKYGDKLPEQVRGILREAVSRVNDIVNNLSDYKAKMESNEETVVDQSVELLFPLIDQVVSEKRLSTQSNSKVKVSLNVKSNSRFAFSKIIPVEFKRVLSNTINNAIESLHGQPGKVDVVLYDADNMWAIEISDDGVGIPKDIVNLLGQMKVTKNKSGGKGLGLFHAFKTIRSWGGTIEVAPQAEGGTVVAINLPKVAGPEVYAQGIEIRGYDELVILDDDTSIHQMWDDRLSKYIGEINVVHFYNGADFEKWYKLSGKMKRLFLVDYELLNQELNGLDIVLGNSLQENSYLVTSHYDNSCIIARCTSNDIKVIPKMLAANVAITGPVHAQ